MKMIITAGRAPSTPRAPATAVPPIGLTASRPTPLNKSLNESDAISQDPVQAIRSLLNETVALRHRFRDVMGESTNSPVSAFAQRGDKQPVRRTVYERLWRPISFYAASGVRYRAGQRRAASAPHLSTAQRLLDVPVESVQPRFSLAIHQDGDYRLCQVECTQIYLLQVVLNVHISTLGLTRHEIRRPPHVS
jgi:hypothetical protein